MTAADDPLQRLRTLQPEQYRQLLDHLEQARLGLQAMAGEGGWSTSPAVTDDPARVAAALWLSQTGDVAELAALDPQVREVVQGLRSLLTDALLRNSEPVARIIEAATPIIRSLMMLGAGAGAVATVVVSEEVEQLLLETLRALPAIAAARSR